jgi:transcriptional regulator GlxA family with amidase domain
VVIVPAIGAKTAPTLDAAIERRDVTDAGDLLRSWTKAGTHVASACTGTFVVAASTLLDGVCATTTWWLAPLFRERFPRVTLDDSRMVVESARFITAGAALAHMDLALWILRRKSPALAAQTARYLIVDPRPSQVAYAIPDQLAHSDELVERFERWARLHLADRFSLEDASRAVGASQRTLARRLHTVLGKSPLSYVQDLRVEHALHLLQTSDAGIDEIAEQVGYGDGVTLRALLRRKTGSGLRELRARGQVLFPAGRTKEAR